MPTMALPALTERIDRGAPGGHEFEHLMHQLLLAHGNQHGFIYEPVHGAGGDSGIDGWARNGIPGLEGPIVFQFKWLWDDIHKGEKARQVKNSLSRAEGSFREAGHWILVTPWDLKPSERNWLQSLKRVGGPVVHHWGQQKIENLLRDCPSLFARYFPHHAQEVLGPDYRSVDFKDFAARYRAKVSHNHRRIRTLGFPPEALHERDAYLDIPLRDIFVPLEFQDLDDNKLRTLVSLVNKETSGVILGDPGTGKSTLLSFIALLFSGGASLEGVLPPSASVPIFVSLRDLAITRHRTPGHSLLDYLAAKARADHGLADAHSAFFDSALRMGEAVLLLDGLDEVGSTRARHEMTEVIRNLRHEYPASTMWIASRAYGYTADIRLPRNEFKHFRVGPLTTEQIDHFINRWYTFQHASNTSERTEFTNSLREAVHHTPSVRRLATNPLLLTLMAFVHHGLRRLPQDRGELYALCVTMLLKTWQEVKRRDGEQAIHPFEQLRLHLQTQKDYLAHLAFDMHHRSHPGASEAVGLISRTEALDSLAQRHLAVQARERPTLTLAQAREEMEQFLDYIGDRTGLLIDRGGGVLSFIHLSFQEYLAAWVFTCDPQEHDNIHFFTKSLTHSTWEEVLLLRLYIILREPGGGGHRAFDAVIAHILGHLEKSPSEQGWLFLSNALRDNLAFAAKDRLQILTKLIDLWAEKLEFSGKWFSALQDIIRFSETSKETIKDALNNYCLNSPDERALAALYLRDRLLGFDQSVNESLQRRSNLSHLMPSLTAFSSVPEMLQLVSTHASEADWLRALHTFSSPETYRLTLQWALDPNTAPSSHAIAASAKWLWLEVISEFKSRAALVSAYQPDTSSLFQGLGAICMGDSSYSIELPLSGLQVPSSIPLSLHHTPEPALHASLGYERLSKTLDTIKANHHLGSWAIKLFLTHLPSPSPTVDSELNEFIDAYTTKFVGRLSQYFLRNFNYRSIARFSHDLAGAFSRNYGHRFIQASMPTFASVFVSDESTQAFFALTEHEESLFPPIEHKPRPPANRRRRGSSPTPFTQKSSTRRGGSPASKALNLAPEGLRIQFNSPDAFRHMLTDFWHLAATNHLLLLCRHVAVQYPWGFSESAAATWMRRHPLDVYATALAWSEIIDTFKSRISQHSGPESALLLSHAAYAAAMTGLHFNMPSWIDLSAKLASTSHLARASYYLHEVCHLRKAGPNSRAFDMLVRELTN